jgi:hypothetical protein
MLSEQGDEFERALVRSALADEPPPTALLKAAAALGIATTVATAASSAGAATAVTTAGTAAASAASGLAAAGASSAAVGSLAVVKFVAIGAVSGLCAIGGAHLLLDTSSVPPMPDKGQATLRHTQSRSFASSGSERSQRAMPPTALATPEPASTSAEEVPRAARAPARSARPHTAAGMPSVATFEVLEAKQANAANKNPTQAARSGSLGQALREETAALARARDALKAGHARAALTQLDRYRNEWPNGSLGPEATVLRVEALLALGQDRAARQVAEPLMRARPDSFHARRLRDLLNLRD